MADALTGKNHPEIQLCGDDFVNRAAELALFLETTQPESRRRVLLVGGEYGMGKSYLLAEIAEQCAVRHIAHVYVDLAELREPGYLSLVTRLWEELGPHGFEPLGQAMLWAESLASATPGQELAASGPPLAQEIHAQVGAVGAGAQVAVGAYNTQIQAQVVNILHREHPLVRQRIEAAVTAALHAGLSQRGQEETLVFLFDAWEEATTELRDWLQRTLLGWTLNRKLGDAVAIVAGLEQPRFDRHPLRVDTVILQDLDEEAFRVYWVEKRGLPEELVEAMYAACMGMPLAMRLIADRHARARRSLP